jgi:hypothetical protein
MGSACQFVRKFLLQSTRWNEGSHVKLARWSPYALKNLVDRKIEREQADRTLAAPELIVLGQAGRQVFMRRYFDANL